MKNKFKKIGLRIECNDCFGKYEIKSHTKPKRCRRCESSNIKISTLLKKI